MFQKLYNSMFSENLKIRIITWSIIVIINAIPWFMLAEEFSILWKICWIITWILIYIFIYPFFSWGNKNWKKSVSISYLIHTLTSLFTTIVSIVYSQNENFYYSGGNIIQATTSIIVQFEMMIGITSISIVKVLWFSEVELMWTTYLATLFHAGILSIILLSIAWCIYWISKIWKYIWVNLKSKSI